MILSRVANSIYWMVRYLERAENIARFIDVNLNLTLDFIPGEKDPWGPLVKVTGDRDTFFDQYQEASKENVIQFLTFDPHNPNSIISCIRSELI